MTAPSDRHSSMLAFKLLALLLVIFVPQTTELNFAGVSQHKLSPCAAAITEGFVCEAANQRAVELMNAGQFEAFTVVQNVRTGALVVFAASQPAKLDVATPVLPLSVSKLLLAASWWDHAQPDTRFDSYRGAADTRKPSERLITIHEMLVGGSDNAGRLAAIALRKSVGTESLLDDFKRYGFGRGDDSFWKEVSPQFRVRLAPLRVFVSLSSETNDEAWANSLSLGETNFKVTGLHISRFLQAIGNGGVMLLPVAREQSMVTGPSRQQNSRNEAVRVMKRETAQRLQAGMRDAVKRGTARSIANSLAESGWSIGGKTGTGPGPAPIGPQSDGWFAGLIFDARGQARFTVATFVRHGGTGGGNAARISSELARYLIGKGD